MSIVNWQDSSINEASGLGFSRKYTDLLYTHNDENGPIFAVKPSTGKTVGTCRVKGRTLVDPESIDVDSHGAIWFADIGDNSAGRSSVQVYTRGEFGPNYPGSLPFTRYDLKYPDGAHNAETFIVWPNGTKHIISKESTGSVYKLPSTLKTSASNTMTSVFGPSAALNMVSDAAVSKDGKWVFITRKDQNSTIYVFNTSWSQVGTIAMSTMVKPEGITVAADGRHLWVCDDNSRVAGGILQKVNIPGAWCPAGSNSPTHHYDDGTDITGADPAPAPPVNPCAA